MIYIGCMSFNQISLSSREQAIQSSYEALALHLNERSARVWAASEAKRYGHGGISAVHRATSMDYKTIRKGIQELESEEKLTAQRIRSGGGGRKSLTKKYPGIDEEVCKVVESSTRGDPESLLLWTSKSTCKLAEALNEAGYLKSHRAVHIRCLKLKVIACKPTVKNSKVNNIKIETNNLFTLIRKGRCFRATIMQYYR